MNTLPYAELDHTADLCLRATGDDLPGLFAHAAQGLFALLRCQAGEARQPVSRRIALQADDLESLLVDWLNELLYLAERHHEAYERFEVTLLDAQRLDALALGWDQQRAGRCVKAATFFGLSVSQTAAGYEATITLDV
jgi:SHS2 domain-containing protein